MVEVLKYTKSTCRLSMVWVSRPACVGVYVARVPGYTSVSGFECWARH